MYAGPDTFASFAWIAWREQVIEGVLSPPEFIYECTKVIIPIGKRNGAEKTTGEKREIVSRDARASSVLIWDAARERTLIQLIQKVILSLLKATLLPSHSPVQEGIPREDGGGRTPRLLEDFKSSGRTSPPPPGR